MKELHEEFSVQQNGKNRDLGLFLPSTVKYIELEWF